jgi:hypothetical protein
MAQHSVFHRGDGVASGIDYGMSDHDHTGQKRAVAPRLLFGDPESVKAVVRSMKCKQRYTAGVIACAEANLPEAQKRQIIAEHLRMVAPGLDPSRLAICYIEHRDKGNLEIHYWGANLDLETGKRLNLYYHRADCRRMRLWMQSLNDRLGLADPNDPKRWRLCAPPKKDAPESRKTLQSKLLLAIEKLALAGSVKCRADIEHALTRAGWSISRRTRIFISVTHSSLKMPVRLAGRVFAQNWDGTVAPDVIERLAHEFVEARQTRLRETAAELIQLVETRRAYNCKRYRSEPIDDPLLDELITVRDAPIAAQLIASSSEAASLPGAAQPSSSQPRARPLNWSTPWTMKPQAKKSNPSSKPNSESSTDFPMT